MSEEEVQIEKEIEDRRKLTDEAKQNIKNKIFKNLILSVIYMLVIIAINVVFLKISTNIFSITAKVASVVSMVITVILFEIAYRKENLEMALYAIELMVISIIIMYIPYAYIHMGENIRKALMLSPAYIFVYYVIKNIVTNIKLRKDYLNSLSDIKEIVKDDENTSYLDEDSKKIIKETNEIEARKKEEQKIKKENKKKANKTSKATKASEKKAETAAETKKVAKKVTKKKKK
jgi:prepilin signal peptidase PulO-like enzyme (type II secretory pathway)